MLPITISDVFWLGKLSSFLNWIWTLASFEPIRCSKWICLCFILTSSLMNWIPSINEFGKIHPTLVFRNFCDPLEIRFTLTFFNILSVWVDHFWSMHTDHDGTFLLYYPCSVKKPFMTSSTHRICSQPCTRASNRLDTT